MWAVFFQVMAVAWIWGADNLYLAIEDMAGVKLTPWWKLCWKFFGPFFQIVSISQIHCVFDFRPKPF